jgi:L-2-hydroxyglutarate oxidase
MQDITIIGGGLVGLATAYQINKLSPALRVTLIEKEQDVCKHQSGRNSGVIHTGIYYKPGSLKAINCKIGREELIKFAEKHNVAHKITGKFIIATSENELSPLNDIYTRGQANGVECRMVEPDFIHSMEPHVAAIKGIHVPTAGIIDYPGIAQQLLNVLRERGVTVLLGHKLERVEKRTGRIFLCTNQREIETAKVINCAGLYSDHVGRMMGITPKMKIVPFRGEYYDLKPEHEHLVKIPIYPVPNMNFPFLGVHFTPRVTGGVECGPNAVLALAREGYTWSHLNISELLESLSYPGFLKLAGKYWREGWDEIRRSLSKKIFTRALQRLVPAIQEDFLVPGNAGVRAQAISPDGKLIDDFFIEQTDNIVSVFNAPSPGATSCFNIGRSIAQNLNPNIVSETAM